MLKYIRITYMKFTYNNYRNKNSKRMSQIVLVVEDIALTNALLWKINY